MNKHAREITIEADRIRLLYAQGRPNSLVPLAVGLILVLGYWGRIPHTWLLTWYGLMCLNLTTRLLLLRAFHRREPRDVETSSLGWSYCATALASGIQLGTFVFLLPGDRGPTSFFVVIVVITGFVAGSITANAYHSPSLVAYLS